MVTTKMLLPLENWAWFINTSYPVSVDLLAGRLSKSGLLCKDAHLKRLEDQPRTIHYSISGTCLCTMNDSTIGNTITSLVRI